MIERPDFALNAAAAGKIDHRMNYGAENFSCTDYIRAAEEDDGVTIRVGRSFEKI